MLHAREKIVANILRKITEKKTVHKLRDDQCGFRIQRGNRVAIGMLRITLGRVLTQIKTLCWFHVLAEDQIDEHSKGNLYRLA
jgi:hypothetical protein